MDQEKYISNPKTALLAFFLLFPLALQGQNQNQLVVKLEGFGKTNNLRLWIDGSYYETNNSGNILFNGKLEIKEPTLGKIVKKNGLYAGFWLEPGASNVTVRRKNFTSGVLVPGSRSHSIYLESRFAGTPAKLKSNMLKYKDEVVALDVWNSFFKYQKLSRKDVAEIYNQIDPKFEDRIKDVRAFLATANADQLKKGDAAIDFIAQNSDHEEFNTIAYRGKYLLIDFAATYCSWCWVGYPELIEKTSAFKNLQVITFNEDENIQTWNRIADERSLALPWPVLWHGKNKEEIFELYGIETLPTFFLISPDGEVLEAWSSASHSRLKTVLNKHLR